MSNAISPSESAMSTVSNQADVLVSRLKNLVERNSVDKDSEETPTNSFAVITGFHSHMQSHTAENGEIKPGIGRRDEASEPRLTRYRATKHLGRVDRFFPDSVGVGARKRSIHSGDLVVSVKRAGSDAVERTPIPILNADDARGLDAKRRDLADAPATTLEKLASKIDAIAGISAYLENGRLNVTAQDSTTKFSIEDHGTGLLQEMGGQDIEVREAFDRFVGTTFYGQMLSAMRKTVQEPAYFHGGRAEEMFRKQLDMVLSEELTKSGSGEFSESLYKAQFDVVA
ncbi:MAG: rod-binding protein [Pirellulales bacterium]|nr:rod-binding protein [Pirellulales bacterium]